MKKISIILSAIAITLLSFTKIAPSTWALDPAHSQLNFSISMFSLSDIQGTFKITQGTITAPKDDFSDAAVSITADIRSIDTDNDDRDKHLRTADFFDAEKFPDLTFKSTSFQKLSETKYKVMGDLSFHGVTKPVTLDAIGKQGTHPVTKKTIAGFKVTGIIKRSDFGISPSSPPAMLSDDVMIVGNVQFVKN